jgi:hypothetical protein
LVNALHHAGFHEKQMRRTVQLLAALLGVVAALLGSAPTRAADAGAPADRQLCAVAAAAAEAGLRVPANLLKAMAAVESGFWPWAVRARGKAHMMPSHQAAVKLVQRLRQEGVQDIMIGCMQIHLRYHSEAFASIEQALEPSANAAYAGRYLSSLARGASWWDAVGRYQGGKPSARRAYVQKVASAYRAGAPLPGGRDRKNKAQGERIAGDKSGQAKSGADTAKATAPLVLADAPFPLRVEGVLDMTPFVNLDFGDLAAPPEVTLIALAGPHIF